MSGLSSTSCIHGKTPFSQQETTDPLFPPENLPQWLPTDLFVKLDLNPCFKQWSKGNQIQRYAQIFSTADTNDDRILSPVELQTAGVTEADLRVIWQLIFLDPFLRSGYQYTAQDRSHVLSILKMYAAQFVEAGQKLDNVALYGILPIGSVTVDDTTYPDVLKATQQNPPFVIALMKEDPQSFLPHFVGAIQLILDIPIDVRDGKKVVQIPADSLAPLEPQEIELLLGKLSEVHPEGEDPDTNKLIERLLSASLTPAEAQLWRRFLEEHLSVVDRVELAAGKQFNLHGMGADFLSFALANAKLAEKNPKTLLMQLVLFMALFKLYGMAMKMRFMAQMKRSCGDQNLDKKELWKEYQNFIRQDPFFKRALHFAFKNRATLLVMFFGISEAQARLLPENEVADLLIAGLTVPALYHYSHLGRPGLQDFLIAEFDRFCLPGIPVEAPVGEQQERRVVEPVAPKPVFFLLRRRVVEPSPPELPWYDIVGYALVGAVVARFPALRLQPQASGVGVYLGGSADEPFGPML